MPRTRQRIVATPARRRPHSRKSVREPAKVTDWLQTLATIIAAALAAWAAFLALDALRDQRDINQSQKELNEAARERADRRYAYRVAFWREWDPKVISIQNRAPVPITNVYVRDVTRGQDEADSFDAGIVDIPPCAIATVSITDLLGERPTFIDYELRFSDPAGRWILTNDGLRKVLPSPPKEETVVDLANPPLVAPPVPDFIGSMPAKFQQAADCGEGG